VSLLLRESDFSTAVRNLRGHQPGIRTCGVRAPETRASEVDPEASGVANLTAVLARIENLTVPVHRRARV